MPRQGQSVRLRKIDNFLPSGLANSILFQKADKSSLQLLRGQRANGASAFRARTDLELRERAVKLLKSFTGVNLCAGLYSRIDALGTPARCRNR
jgi:hypothetical protein